MHLILGQVYTGIRTSIHCYSIPPFAYKNHRLSRFRLPLRSYRLSFISFSFFPFCVSFAFYEFVLVFWFLCIFYTLATIQICHWKKWKNENKTKKGKGKKKGKGAKCRAHIHRSCDLILKTRFDFRFYIDGFSDFFFCVDPLRFVCQFALATLYRPLARQAKSKASKERHSVLHEALCDARGTLWCTRHATTHEAHCNARGTLWCTRHTVVHEAHCGARGTLWRTRHTVVHEAHCNTRLVNEGLVNLQVDRYMDKLICG